MASQASQFHAKESTIARSAKVDSSPTRVSYGWQAKRRLSAVASAMADYQSNIVAVLGLLSTHRHARRHLNQKCQGAHNGRAR
jgi:hypothetical protein